MFTLTAGACVGTHLTRPAHRLLDRGDHDVVADLVDQPALLGEGDERQGSQQAALGVRPAHQRLHGDDLSADQVEDRLVVDDQLAAIGRATQAGLEVETVDRRLVHLVGEHLVAVLAGRLGRVHGQVRVAQQLVDAGARGAVGDPDARRRADLRGRQRHGCLEHPEDALGDAGGVVGPGQLVDEDGELVAAQAGGGVAGTEARDDPLAHRDQQRVARGVPEAVVHRLEVVEVDEHDGQLPAVSCRDEPTRG